MKRQHPVAIIGYTSKNFWLLLIPLVRGLVALKFDFYKWAEGAGWDILIVAVMIAIAVIRWYCTCYEICSRSIKIRTGMVIRRTVKVWYKSVCAVTSEENPVYGRLGAVRTYIDTDAASGGRKSADINLMIFIDDRARLFNLLSKSASENPESPKMRYTYKVSAVSLIIFSLLFSSALSGVALLVTFLSGGTEIIGEQLERDFVNIVNGVSEAVTRLADKLISGISPAGIAISVIIAAGFLISFILNVLRYVNFTVTRRDKCIIVSGGLITKRMYYINTGKINMADMKQNLLMKLFGITSVNVNCTGYGKRKNEIPVFVPVCSIRRVYDGKGFTRLDSIMSMLLPGFSRCDSYINTKLVYLWRFIWPPALLIYAILGGGFIAAVFFQHWYNLISFITVMLEIPAVWLLFAKVCAYCTNGINITEDSVCAKYSRGYSFHTVTVPLERVAEIRISQTVFQRMNKSCDVIIYTNSEYIGSHRVSGMPIIEIQELLRERF